MQSHATSIPGVLRLTPRRFHDRRGFFVETYHVRRFAELGITANFVQDNLSFSTQAGTVRGLHFQRPPMAQAKLISVVRGAILDVAVDVRQGSPTYGHHVAVRLSAEEGNALFIPAGCAHGLCTLEADTAVAYKVDAYYSGEHDTGIFWADPALAIPWSVTADRAEVSDKDRVLPVLAQTTSGFVYER